MWRSFFFIRAGVRNTRLAKGNEMKFIFRRELGEEHLFVLWQSQDGKVTDVPEWRITISVVIAMVLWLFMSDKTSEWECAPILLIMVFIILFDRCCQLPAWRRPD
jgi:hypothetical protein